MPVVMIFAADLHFGPFFIYDGFVFLECGDLGLDIRLRLLVGAHVEERHVVGHHGDELKPVERPVAISN